SGTLFVPAQSNGLCVVINGAMGVRHTFYQAFAQCLAAAGCVVVAYDYRGMGASRAGAIRAEDATLWQWGRQDVSAALAYAHERWPEHRLWVVGHSLGGQLLGLAEHHEWVKGLLAVATPNGYWGHWPRPLRYALAALWHVGMPSLTNVCGYFPARLLRLGGADLPAGVAHEWARWCRHPDYVLDPHGRPWRAGFAAFRGRVWAYGVDDDWMAPEASIQALMLLYVQAQVCQHTVRAAEVGQGDKIGHFGFFRPGQTELWAEALAKMLVP
ncbi:MAG: alpha/beta fold hydrolase, partial [Neisseriaceae bacterium]|nr:alpha/beta fold hydrolase [Neisseriaceae bacterium]